MTAEICNSSLKEIATSIQAGEISSKQLTKFCLEAIERTQPQLNCFISVNNEYALQQAARADDELARGSCRGPLHGVPMAHKDIFYRAGFVTTSGAAALHHHIPRYTSTIISAFDRAGAIDLGRTNLSEFCIGATGANEHFGDCGNPWNSSIISGGSSSGSAAAIAAKLIYGSIGSDTGGSIRLPSAICGVTGLKTGQNMVSAHGVMQRCPTFDCFGPMARSAEDVALLFATLTDNKNVGSGLAGKSKPFRLGVARSFFWPQLASGLETIHETALEALGFIGADIKETPLIELSEINRQYDLINRYETSVSHANTIEGGTYQYGNATLKRVLSGRDIPVQQIHDVLTQRPAFSRKIADECFREIDVIYSPVITIHTPGNSISDPNEEIRLAADLTKHTRWVSYTGFPAVAFPCGFTGNNIPVGGQLIGPPGSELKLLDIVNSFQKMTPWHNRNAPIGDFI